VPDSSGYHGKVRIKGNRAPYLNTIFVFFACLLISSNLQANNTEKNVDTGLVDVHDIDHSIAVDHINSDRNKYFFEVDFYNGLNKAYLRKDSAVL
jgi:D-alanyl-D-alanine dipeptidase